MNYLSAGGEKAIISDDDLRKYLYEIFRQLGHPGRILVIPPDFTRFHSRAGQITEIIWEYFGDRVKAILPAIGTHVPMTEAELKTMYGKIPLELFRVHRWREDAVTVGRVPASYVSEVSDGLVDYEWPAQVNKMIPDGGFDLILSVGQVVPHEVAGMANYNKNIFVGTGGKEGINKSHYLGAVYGMERMMGRADNPVRRVLGYASREFGSHWPIVYIQTVIGSDENGKNVMRGLFAGDDEQVFLNAAALSMKVNFLLIDQPWKKAVVYLSPDEFRSTWLGNKSIYRTRMALADNAELIVLAPGVKEFGEDPEIDRLIRKYGYRNREEIIHRVQTSEDLRENLGTAAHLIHGSSEGRFRVTYATQYLSSEEIENVGFSWMPLDKAMALYPPGKLKDGVNQLASGEEIFFISNPALGLWAAKERFGNQ